MIEKESGLLGRLTSALGWITSHPYAAWGIFTAFLASLRSSHKDGKGLAASLFAGLPVIAITVSVLTIMRKTGLHEEWMPIVGMLLGFIDADPIRAVVLGAWDSHKNRFNGEDKNG